MRTTTVIAALLASACAKTPATDHTTDNSTDPCIKLIENGGFENGLAHWTPTGDVSVQTTDCEDGDKCALVAAGGTISQSATIPTDGITSLRFQFKALCPDPGIGGPLGRMLDASGAELFTLVRCNGDDRYQEGGLELTQYGGQTLTLEFSVPDGPATLVVDAVKLENHPDEGPVNLCGVGSCDGNPECEDCLQAGECASGPDPMWNGHACVCADFTPATCELPWCCPDGTHWDAKACELGILDACMDDKFANTCGVGDCGDDAACEACLAGPACDSGVQPVWSGTACLCPIPPPAHPPKNCFLPYCCADGTHWDTTRCACIPGPLP